MKLCVGSGGPNDHQWIVFGTQVVCETCDAVLSAQELLESYMETRRMVEAGVAVLAGELEELRADVVAAAGELRVSLDDMPPGSPCRRVVVANRLLRNSADKHRAESARLQVAIVRALRAIKTHDSVGAVDILETAMIRFDS